jgi:hypothetical protein
MKRYLYAFLAASAVVSVSGTAWAQTAPGDAPVTREEIDKMMKDMADLRQEVTQLRAERAAASQAATQSAGQVSQLQQQVDTLKKQRAEDVTDSEDRQAEIEKIMKDVMTQARSNALGEQKLLITGDADVGFSAMKGDTSTFSAGVAPRFLWKFNDKLMFDAAFDIGVDTDPDSRESSTTFDLTIASATYAVCDYMVIGGGLFVTPFAAYHRDFDPSWITKLPDDPLVFSDPNALAPESVLGVFASGACPIGPTKVNYAIYLCNGPELETTAVGPDANAGSLRFDNYVDNNNNKAFGFRIGFLPIPEVEVGYSLMYGQASAPGDPHANALLQALDFNYTRASENYGQFTLRAEWVWSDVTDVPFGAGPGALFFDNHRDGGYVQISYRPTQVSIKELRNLEGVFRYDRVEGPNAAPIGGGSEDRYTIGLNYWLDARTVLKVAYEFDDRSLGGSAPGFMMQFGLGF